MFRKLKANEIECRVGSCTKSGFSLLLYKDARCDMAILDETVGAMYWERKHSRDNANCTVSIYDKHMDAWVSKEDTGTESFTEKEKGIASDSFKRACVNWGIGRELYTAPFIWISGHTIQDGNRYKTDGYDRGLKVTEIGYNDNGEINRLLILDKNGVVAFDFGAVKLPEFEKKIRNEAVKKITAAQVKTVQKTAESKGVDVGKILDRYQIDRLEDMTAETYAKCLRELAL